MVEIEFSVMESAAGDASNLLPLLEAFEKQYHIHVNLTGITWSKGWGEIAKYGIYGNGPDVSAIGTTWIGSLAAMQTLRPFTEQQIKSLGGETAFFEAIWQTGLLAGDPTPWAIPWLADVHIIYYWQDALEKAGISDPEAAFASEAALVDTVGRLHQDAGYAYPLDLTTIQMPVILHEAAHWVWSAGGDFMSPDNRRVTFNQPAALQGFRNYFRLRPFISPKSFTAVAPGSLFNAREAAVFLGGPFPANIGRVLNPEWGERLGGIQSRGVAFVGGSSFVIWKYSTHPQEAFELVRFLSSQPTRIPASPHDQGLPTRREAVNMPSVETDVFHRTFLHSLQQGRGFPTMRLWGSIEDKLVAKISDIWTDLFADPEQDLDACLHKHLDPLAQRLNIILGN